MVYKRFLVASLVLCVLSCGLAQASDAEVKGEQAAKEASACAPQQPKTSKVPIIYVKGIVDCDHVYVASSGQDKGSLFPLSVAMRSPLIPGDYNASIGKEGKVGAVSIEDKENLFDALQKRFRNGGDYSRCINDTQNQKAFWGVFVKVASVKDLTEADMQTLTDFLLPAK